MKPVVLHKKILVVSTWAPPMVGGSMALYDLLSAIDARSYCILTSMDNISSTLENFTGRGAWLPCKYFFYDRRRQTYTHTTRRKHRALSKHSSSWQVRLLGQRRIQPAALIISILQISLVIARMVWIGVRVARTENIARIVGVSDQGPALLASYITSRLTGRSYALYLFDIYRGNRLSLAYRLLAMSFEPILVKNASVVIVTNEETEKLYSQRYGKKFKSAIIHNAITSQPYLRNRTPYKPAPPYSIVYTGLIYWAQERSISNLINAMDHLTECPIRLDLYIPNADQELMRAVKKHRNVRLLAADREEMPAVQSRATVLFLPLSWRTGNPDVIMTASPAKLTDYLASGRPILVHAPPGSFVNNYAKKNNFAVVVDAEGTEILANAVRKLISDTHFARRLIRAAIRTFHRNHEASVNARKFAEILD